MVQKFRFGTPIKTEATVAELSAIKVNSTEDAAPLARYVNLDFEKGFTLTRDMAQDDAVYGLGEANRGINKRGYQYVSCCTDDPNHTEEKVSLYGAHNFLMVIGKESFGLFIDYPADVRYDIGYTKQDKLAISVDDANLDVYLITCEDETVNNSHKSTDSAEPSSHAHHALCITRQFRELIGISYIPPLWAFGYIQSRWGYMDEEDIRRVAKGYRENHLPLDSISMDIDYMEDYKDFTVHPERFPDLTALSAEMKEQGLHFIPIIDAGVKIEKGYDVYEDGVKNNYFCKRGDGTDFVAGVWPGKTHFPDFLNADARKWFGGLYKRLTDSGIEGFWNDMNEPAIFFSEEGIEEAAAKVEELLKVKDDPKLNDFWAMQNVFNINNDHADYKRFYHNMGGKKIRHDKVHNLYGYNMTRAAAEAFDTICPDKRLLLFSRSSYIGMHRYGGIWTGDNQSWWSHLLLNIKMMPSLNMCGFLYSGADLGGFGSHTTRDLLLRWLAFGIFTPLMRNHAALGTREQECYQFEGLDDFREILKLRYRLIPYIYSEFVKAALGNTLLFSPLAFAWPQDKVACEVEDQLLLGESLMLAPVYKQNVTGRTVYLPEGMLLAKFTSAETYTLTKMEAGWHYIDCALNEVAFFIRTGHLLPLCPPCECTKELDYDKFELLGEKGMGLSYELYMDDGYTKNVGQDGKYIKLTL
jgi:alpha-glucosidase